MRLLIALSLLAWSLLSQQSPVEVLNPTVSHNFGYSVNTTSLLSGAYSHQAIDLFQITASPSPTYYVVMLHWALGEGTRFLGILDGHRDETAYTTLAQLQFPAGGWAIEEAYPEMATAQRYAAAYQQYGIHSANGQDITVELNNKYINCHHPATEYITSRGGSFRNIFNVPGRSIVALDNWSRTFELKQSAGANNMNDIDPQTGWQLKTMLPYINRWSEVTWIIWQHQVSIQPPPNSVTAGDLKYVFRHHIETDETLAIMKVLAGKLELPGNDNYVHNWPGTIYAKGSPEFQAILGTPHGKGVVFLIAFHPHEMPTKNIESVRFFTTPQDGAVAPDKHLLFVLTG